MRSSAGICNGYLIVKYIITNQFEPDHQWESIANPQLSLLLVSKEVIEKKSESKKYANVGLKMNHIFNNQNICSPPQHEVLRKASNLSMPSYQGRFRELIEEHRTL